ncbi:MAG: hypothetical protein ACXIUM_11875 [Wenzhouxiangella sp.]
MADHPKDWSELAISLWDKLTGRNAEISYEFKDFLVDIPTGPGDDAVHARWGVSGTLIIRGRELPKA